MNQTCEERNTEKHQGYDYEEKTDVSLGFTNRKNLFLKVNSRPKGQACEHLVNSILVAIDMGVFNQDLNSFILITHKGICAPNNSAGRIAKHGVLRINLIWLAITFYKGQVDVIDIKGNGKLSPVNANVLAIRRKHM